MLSGLTSIHFSTQLEYPPFEAFRIQKGQVRKLYNALSDQATGFNYENLELQGDKPTLSTKKESGLLSRCQISGSNILYPD